MTNLIIDEAPALDFSLTEVEKRAHTPLDEDPTAWPRQLLLELHRQLPEAAEYSPTVMMVFKDDERGSAVGAIEVSGEVSTALALAKADSHAPRAFIPFIIKDHTLCPLDLLMRPGGTFVPLSAQRLREALFRPEAFAALSQDGSSSSLYNTFYPPGRSDNSPGSGQSQGGSSDFTTIQGPGMKYSGLLAEIRDTIYGSDLERLEAVLAEPGVKEAGMRNEHFITAMACLEEAQTVVDSDHITDVQKTAAATAGVDVAQLSYEAGVYTLKTANRRAYSPDTQFLGRGDALKVAGEEMVGKVDTDGPQTVGGLVRVESALDMDAEEWDTAEKPGVYRVLDTLGKEHTGWVLPKLLNTETGEPGGLSVFTNGSVAAVQPGVLGSPVSTTTFNVPNNPPKGTGIFYVMTSGGAVGLEPVEVLGREHSDAGSFVYSVTTAMGVEHKIRMVVGLRSMQVTDGEIMLPSETRFLPVDGEIAIKLLSSPEEIQKTAGYFDAAGLGFKGGDGHMLDVVFHNMPKLASTYTGRVTAGEAVFLGAVAGADPEITAAKVASAIHGATETIAGTDVRLLADVLSPEEKQAALKTSAEIRAMRRDLTKEAAAIPDASTVDAVLGLNFISSENLRSFVQRTPYMENALNTVCELLLASRLGISEIPEQAAARAARGLDDVIRGLRALALREVDET
jgi:hypothetical protein